MGAGPAAASYPVDREGCLEEGRGARGARPERRRRGSLGLQWGRAHLAQLLSTLSPAGTAALSPSRDPWPTVDRARLPFEEAADGGGAATACSPGGPPENCGGSARKRQLAGSVARDRALPPSMSSGAPGPGVGCEAGEEPPFLPSASPAPRVKRLRLEVVKKLNFRPEEMEEPPLPDSPAGDITPPPSPEVPTEPRSKGCVAWGAGFQRPAAEGGWEGCVLVRIWVRLMVAGAERPQDSPCPFPGPWTPVSMWVFCRPRRQPEILS